MPYKKIGIFGGSFDPPHLGHLEICRHFLNTEKLDQIWVVPCYKHPYSKEMASFDDRITMCKFAFGEFFGRVKISDIEKVMGGISYTVSTLERFITEYPDNRYYLLLGEDAGDDYRNWKGAKRIENIAKIMLVPRGEGSFIPDISSTEIRKAIETGGNFRDKVTKEVAVYIVTHGLYS